jgi:hypothetical protein
MQLGSALLMQQHTKGRSWIFRTQAGDRFKGPTAGTVHKQHIYRATNWSHQLKTHNAAIATLSNKSAAAALSKQWTSLPTIGP